MRFRTADSARRGRLRDSLLAMLAVGLLVAACGGTTTASAPTSSSSSASASGTQVNVEMTEFALKLSRSDFAPGTYTFVATNAGKTAHAIEVEGPGVSEQKTAVVSPGQSASLTVTLQAGKYEIYCPVDGHKGMGMKLELTVGGAAGSTTSPDNKDGSSGGSGGGGY